MDDNGKADEQIKMIVISSCSASKSVEVSRPIRMSEFADPDRLRNREREMSSHALPAWELYAGRQHIQLMKGVQALRLSFGHDAITLKIVSAGYGLVDEHQPLAPYEATFKELSSGERRKWARTLGIAMDVRTEIRGFPLVVFLLGSAYLDAIEPPVEPEPGQRLLYLAAPGEASRLHGPGVTVVPAGRAAAHSYGDGLVALKGKMFLVLAQALVERGPGLWRRLTKDDTPGTFIDSTGAGGRAAP
jgi:hypothetical protein